MEAPFPFSRKRIQKRLVSWAQNLIHQARVKVRVEYDEPILLKPHQPYILMCNHRSFYDIPISILGLSQWTIRMLAKKELFDIPLWSAAMRRAEFISIDRRDAQKAMESLEQAKEKMKEGVMIWIAPEGTRSENGELGNFKPGGFKMAMDMKAVIVPSVILGSEKIMPKGKVSIVKGCEVTLRLGKPIETQNYGERGRKKLMADLRQTMEALIAGDPLPHSYPAPLPEGEGFPGISKSNPRA